MPLPLIFYGLTFATGYGASVLINRELMRKPEEGSFFDSINDGVNAIPSTSRNITTGLVAVSVAITVRAIYKSK